MQKSMSMVLIDFLRKTPVEEEIATEEIETDSLEKISTHCAPYQAKPRFLHYERRSQQIKGGSISSTKWDQNIFKVAYQRNFLLLGQTRDFSMKIYLILIIVFLG